MNKTIITSPLTIHSLRKQGYKVRCFHQRFCKTSKALMQSRWFKENKYQDLLEIKGGLTTLQITTPQGKDFQVQAKCSKKDEFNRKKAIQICLGRFVKKMEEAAQNH